jgi:hypothetical protein
MVTDLTRIYLVAVMRQEALVESALLTVYEDEKLWIPHNLKLKILEVQVKNGCDWSEACEIAASMLDPEEESKRIKLAARRLMNSELMLQLNKSRSTIEAKARKEGGELVRQYEENFWTPCSKCGKPMHFDNRLENWQAVKKVLEKAFENWSHGGCR